MKLNDVEILATPCEVHVTEDGVFSVYLRNRADAEDARSLASDVTLDAAIEKAKPEVRKRKVKVAVPFVTTSGKRGVATGFHAGTGNVLVTWADGKTEQLSRRYGNQPQHLRADTPPTKLTRLEQIREESEALVTEAQAIRREHQLDLLTAVETAIEEARD